MTVVSPECVAVSSGDNFPATARAKVSAESNFRELDDAFLQTQTRIWLGEVLQIRLDEKTDISDILADGKLLSELSEVLSKMLPSLTVDATQSKMNEWKSFVSSKSTQRYMPYYNVGSFLKMCKNLELDGIDLFSPSDVVERRNTRKVCMCIRSLSKKTRSRDLNVPDFDSVTCTLTMPTNMVERIRKSLEKSQSTSSLSDGVEVDKVPTPSARFRTRISNSASTVSQEYSSDVCDDAESILIVGEVNSPSDHAYDDKSPNMSSSEVTGDYSPALHLKTRYLENEEDDQCEYLSPSNRESVGSPCSQYFSDQEISSPLYYCIGSRVSGKVDSNNEAKSKYKIDDLSHTPFDLEDGHQNLEYHGDDPTNIDESNCVSLDNQNTDKMVKEDNLRDEVIVQRGSSPDSCESSSMRADKFDDIDDPLISPTFIDQVEVLGQLIHGNDNIISDETTSSTARYDTEVYDAGKKSLENTQEHSDHDNAMELLKARKNCSDNSRVIPEDHRPLEASSNGKVINVVDKLVLNSFITTLDDSQPETGSLGSMAAAGLKLLLSTEDIEKGKTELINQESVPKETPQAKPQRKLLKSVAKGTALLGIAVFLLHLRKNRQQNSSIKGKQMADVLKQSTPAPSPKKGHKGGKASSVYPAEKLKFGF